MPDGGEVLTFRIGARRLAVPAAEVAEVLRAAAVTRVPHAPAALSGVTSIRGQVVPIVSLGRLLGDDSAARSALSRIVLLQRSPPIGLEVDEVTTFGANGVAVDGGKLIDTSEGVARLIDLDGLLQAQFGELARTRTQAPATAGRDAALTAEAEAEAALLIFDVAGQIYALALEHVAEVVAAPPEIAALPGSDEAMLGAFHWRGELLPAVSLRALLGMPAGGAGADRRMILARLGEASIGLLVDGLRGVLRAPESAIGPVPRVLNRGAGEARIEALLRTRDGQGLVSILAPERLFDDASVAQIVAQGREQGSGRMSDDRAQARGESFVVFRLGDEAYGLPIASVEEVVNVPEQLTRVPRAPAYVAGVMNLRGLVLPVIEQRQRFGLAAKAGARRRVVVTRVGDLRAGFLVDEVSEILQIEASRIAPTPELTAEAQRLFSRVAELEDGRMILLVDPQQLLDRAERDLVAAMAETAAAPPA